MRPRTPARCGGRHDGRERPLGWRGCGLLLALVAAAHGCGGGTKPPARPGADAPEAAGDLPEVDPQTTITVDDDRVSVSSPVGWSRAPRSKDCLVRYLPGKQGGYPSITLLGADPPAGTTSVTKENHDAFVAAVAADLQRTFTHNGKSTLLRKPRALALGPHLAVSWLAPGRATVGGMKQDIERDCVALVIDGRMYTVEARAPRGKLDAPGRAAARAVAANLAAAGSAPAPAADPTKPADAAADPAEPTDPAPDPAAEPKTPDPASADAAAAD